MRLSGTKTSSVNQYRGLGNQLWDLAGNRPSLDLQFSDQKSLVDATTGSNLVTFTRASGGTYVGSDGLIQTAANDVPRFDHNPTTGESLGLLVEEQRTNLLLQSEDFSTTWAANNANVTTNATNSPTGSLTADLLVENTANNIHAISQGSVTSGVTYTVSVYAKAAGRFRLQITGLGAEGQGYFTDYNLAAATVSSAPPGSSITPVGNGWYRCVMPITASSTTGVTLRLRDAAGNNSYTGDGTSGIYLWGAQLEAGAFPTSYTPTTTAAATRAADVASITGSAFASWYRQDEGTVFADGNLIVAGTNSFPRIVSLAGPNSGTDEISLYTRRGVGVDDGRIFGAVTVSSSLQGDMPPPVGSGVGLYKSALAYRSNDFALSNNGLGPNVDTSGTLPTATQLIIMGIARFQPMPNGRIRRLTYWPQRLPNSTLQQITQ